MLLRAVARSHNTVFRRFHAIVGRDKVLSFPAWFSIIALPATFLMQAYFTDFTSVYSVASVAKKRFL